MSVYLKTPEEVEKMRIAGRLAGEVLDYITPHVRSGVTTDELDALCHEYMIKIQGTTPAPLNYAPPGYVPTPSPSALRSITLCATAYPGLSVSSPGTSSTST